MRSFHMFCDRCRNITVVNLENPVLDSCESLAQLCGDDNNSIVKMQIITNCKFCDNQAVDIIIDDELSEVISLLNKKGYITNGCCSGHAAEDMMYISFRDYHDLDFYEKYFTNWNVDPKTYIVNIDYNSYDVRKVLIMNLLDKLRE